MLPSAGAGGLEGLNDIAEAPLHRFEHLYHAMEMVRHTDAGMDNHAVTMGGLDLWGLVPGLLHGFSERGEDYCFSTELGREMGQQVRTRSHHQCDEVCSSTIVVVARIAWSI